MGLGAAWKQSGEAPVGAAILLPAERCWAGLSAAGVIREELQEQDSSLLRGSFVCLEAERGSLLAPGCSAWELSRTPQLPAWFEVPLGTQHPAQTTLSWREPCPASAPRQSASGDLKERAWNRRAFSLQLFLFLQLC